MDEIENVCSGSSRQFSDQHDLKFNQYSRIAPKRHFPTIDKRLAKSSKPDIVTISSNYLNSSETKELVNTLATYLRCSTCSEKKNMFKQCIEGHLLCFDCLKVSVIYCRKCDQYFADKDLSSCNIPTVLMAQKTEDCELCGSVFRGESIECHRRYSCSQRIVTCNFSIYGCVWSGTYEESVKHRADCPLKYTTVKEALNLFNDNLKSQNELDDVNIRSYMGLYSLVSQQQSGYRIFIKSVNLLKTNYTVVNPRLKLIRFRSHLINLSFGGGPAYGFHLEIVVTLDLQNDPTKILYTLNLENEINISVFYCLIGFNVDTIEYINNLRDSFHHHYFEPNHNGSKSYEIKLCDNVDRKLQNRLVNSPLITVNMCILTNESRNSDSEVNSRISDAVMENLFSLMMSNVFLG